MARAKRQPLTARQLEVLAAVAAHFAETGGPPSLREVTDRTGMASLRGANYCLDVLHRKGWLVYHRGCSRGVAVPEIAEAAKLAARGYLKLLKKVKVLA